MANPKSGEILKRILAIASLAFMFPGSTKANSDAPIELADSVGLPANINATEIVHDLIPDWDRRIDEWQKFGHCKDGDSAVSATVVQAAETNFGFVGRNFLVVLVNGVSGVCAHCGLSRLGVIELPSKRLSFLREHDQDGISALREFRMWPDDSSETLSFDESISSLNMAGYLEVHQNWLKTELNPGGSLVLMPVWSGLTRLETTDDVDWTSHSLCATMTSRWPDRSYQEERSSLYVGCGAPQAPCGGESIEEDNWPETWSQGYACDCAPEKTCGTTKIFASAEWSYTKDGRFLPRRFEIKRTDLFPTTSFPFGLRVQGRHWRGYYSPVFVRRGQAGVEVESPDGRLIASMADGSIRVTRRSDGDVVRSISLGRPETATTDKRKHASPTLPGVQFGNFGSVKALGWSRTGDRVLLALALPPEDDWVLLSFGAESESDYWEELHSSLHDPIPQAGFVMEPIAEKAK